MTTVKPSLARRSATAAPIPREAPVTIAILLDSFVISGLLMVARLIRVRWERELDSSVSRIIMHYPASQFDRDEQSDGPLRRDAGVHAGGGTTQFFVGRRGSRPAALHGNGCGG